MFLLLLPLLTGCVSFKSEKFVFGPAKKGETSVSIKNALEANDKKKQAREARRAKSKKFEDMSKDELVQHLKALENKPKKVDKSNTVGDDKTQISPLSFPVKNDTGQVLYVTCFSYLQRHPYSAWRWDKSPICKIAPGEQCLMEIDPVHSKDVEKSIYGYLAIFDTLDDAKQSTYQLLDDTRKLDLDLIQKIGDKTVVLEVERYGVQEQVFDYRLSNDQIQELGFQPELDFFVENKTGKTVHVTCFVYEQQQDSVDSAVWKYSKTPIQTLEAGEIGVIDVASIRDKYESRYMRGALGVFDASEEQAAHNATFQLIPEKKKVKLDRLSALRGKKIVLTIEKYGSSGNFIDYVIKTKPRRKPGESVGE